MATAQSSPIVSGCDLLVSAHEAAQQLGIEVAIGVRDKGPRHAEHPRVSRERTVEQFRQLPVIAGRQSRADLTNLALDEVIVIDQPFGRRRDGAALIDRFGRSCDRRGAERCHCRRAGPTMDDPWLALA